MTSISRQFSSKELNPASAMGAETASNALRRVEQMRVWMQQCRQSTLALFEGINHDRFCQQAHLDFSPVGWHLGHIAFTEGRWILEHLAGMEPLFPEYQKLFAADTLPKQDRIHLPFFLEVKTYLDAVREQVFTYLDTAPFDQQERLWRWLLQHESQHCETIAIVLALQEQAMSSTSDSAFNSSTSVSASEMVYIPAGSFEMGYDGIDAIDNEQPVHQVYLDAYCIDRTPVTCGQYQQFIQAGGYKNAEWWSAEGWNWRQTSQITQPLYWSNDLAKVDHPVWGVNWYEAEAYASFVGKRLPTEAEWEKAARWNPKNQQNVIDPWGEGSPTHACNHNHQVGGTTPIHTYSTGRSASGCEDVLGNVWEWTASWFEGYPGFTAYPYRGYSQVYFDGQHRVLRGGSWATRPWALRATFRNWYHPHVREIFAGFRCVKD